MSVSDSRSGTLDGLQELVRQSERSGARRLVALLHTDRLPPPLARPHHVRLARQAMRSLLNTDRAQMFDLPHGRLAITWRNGGRAELAQVREALQHLLGDEGGADPDRLLTLYDLPDQAVWFLDQLAEGPEVLAQPAVRRAPIDMSLLARLEAGLAQADLSRFTRRRAVMGWADRAMHANGDNGCVAWEERVVAVDELALGLCPERDISSDRWLFRRLTRTLDRCMLTTLSAGRELTGCHTYAIDLNVASILAPEFLRFDEALPMSLRGQIIINLCPADILSDLSGFTFARNFAHARQYRLGLASATLKTLGFMDVVAAGFDVVKVALCPELQASPSSLRSLIPPTIPTVLTGLNRPSELRWARQHGFSYGQGHAFNQ